MGPRYFVITFSPAVLSPDAVAFFSPTVGHIVGQMALNINRHPPRSERASVQKRAPGLTTHIRSLQQDSLISKSLLLICPAMGKSCARLH